MHHDILDNLSLGFSHNEFGVLSNKSYLVNYKFHNEQGCVFSQLPKAKAMGL